MREYAEPSLQPYLRALQATPLINDEWPAAEGVWTSTHKPGAGLRWARLTAPRRRRRAIKAGTWAPKTYRPHRKLWEWGVIARTFDEAGLLREGTRGLGFAVGTEPLSAFFAGKGAEIVASDLGADVGDFESGWSSSNQHAATLDALRHPALCPNDQLDRLVTFRPVDMRAIPDDLRGFDFCWSSCSLEHLGSLQHGLDFVHASLDTLVPGGIAVHTTEANLSSSTDTIDTGGSVIYRRGDFEQLANELRSAGHEVTISWMPGTEPEDLDVDIEPYEQQVHLALHLFGYVSTSYVLVIRKAG